MSFKIGDIVRRNNVEIESSCLNEGDEGVIVEVISYIGTDKKSYMVNFTKTSRKHNRRIFQLREDKLKLVKKGNLGGF